MSRRWYIKTKNGKRGPYSKRRLQRYVDAGAIPANAGIGDGSGRWVAAAKIEGLCFPEEALEKMRLANRAKRGDSESVESINEGDSRLDAQMESIAVDLGLAIDAAEQLTGDDSEQPILRDEQQDEQLRQAEIDAEAKSKELETRSAETDRRAEETDRRAAEIESLSLDLQRRTKELEDRVAELPAQEQSFQEREASIEQRKQENDARDQTLTQLATKLESREQELESRQEKLESREQELESRQEKLESREQELESRQEKLESREQELESREQGLESREQELTAKSDQLDTQQEEALEEARKRIEVENTARVREFAEQSESLQERERELFESEERIAIDQASCDSLRQGLEQRDSELNSRAAEIDRANESLEERQGALSEKEQAIESKQSELAEQQSLLTERESELDTRDAQVQSAQRDLEAQRMAADADAAALEQLKQNVTALESELASVKETLSEQTSELNVLRDQSLTATADIQQIELSGDLTSVTDPPVEMVLSEKNRLLAEFASRQESLSQRESELIRREEELTRRELKITAIGASADETAGVSAVGQGDIGTKEIRDVESPSFASNELEDLEKPGSVEQSPDSWVRHSEEISTEEVHAGSNSQPSSWREVLAASSDSEDAAQGLPPEIDQGDPRFAPVEAIDAKEEAADLYQVEGADQPFINDPSGAVAESDTAVGVSVLSSEADSSVEGAGGVWGHRLPSEISPDELPAFDGYASGKSDLPDVSTESPKPVEKPGAANPVTLMDIRRKAYEDRFGPCARYDADEDSSMRVDISVHQPAGSRDFTTLVTSGMSDYPIPMPNGQRSVRAELLSYATHVDEVAIEVLRGAAKIPFQNQQALSIGAVGSLSEMKSTLSGSNQSDCVYMLPVVESDSKPIATKDISGSSIQLFWLVTISDAERKLIETNGIHRFLALLEKNNHSVYFDLMRDCYLKRKGWFRR